MLETILTDPLSWLSLKMIVSMMAIFISIVIWKYWESTPANMPPGPRPWPIVGNILTFAFAKDKRSYRLLRSMSEKYGNIMTIYLGSRRTIIINDIENAREALLRSSDDFAGRPEFKTVVSAFADTFGPGENIAFGQPGPRWKLMRKLTHTAIRNYAGGEKLETLVHGVMDQVLEAMVNEKTDFNPRQYAALTVINIVAGALFGKRYDLDDPEFTRLKNITLEFLEMFGNGTPSEFLPVLEYVPYLNSKDFRKQMARVIEPFSHMIHTSIKEHRNSFDPDSIKDLTDHLIKVHQDAEDDEDADLLRSFTTDSQLAYIFIDVLGAAIDTTITFLMWTFALLAENQDVQVKLQDEIDQVVGGRLPVLSDRHTMPYAEATLREILRRAVTPVGVPLATLRNTKLGGYDIPKDTMVMINFWAIHYNEEDWPEPEKFRPERFLDEDGTLSDKRFNFMPFGGGRRVCVGESLARSYLFLAICRFVQNYTISPPSDSEFTIDTIENAILAIPKPYNIRVTQRKEA